MEKTAICRHCGERIRGGVVGSDGWAEPGMCCTDPAPEVPSEASEIVNRLEKALDELRSTLTRTADELTAGKIHPAHAANRLRKMASSLGAKA